MVELILWITLAAGHFFSTAAAVKDNTNHAASSATNIILFIGFLLVNELYPQPEKFTNPYLKLLELCFNPGGGREFIAAVLSAI
jgi:hypothetical protein